MSFNNQQIVVYNVYGQRVAIKLVTKPNCFGYIDILDDDAGKYCLRHLYTQALKLHHSEYVDRFVDKPRRQEEWSRIHKSGCDVCDEKAKQFKELRAVPDFDLRRLFECCEAFKAPLRSQKLAYLPKVDLDSSALAQLPSDEEVILELRRELVCSKIACKLWEAKTIVEIKVLRRELKKALTELSRYKTCFVSFKIDLSEVIAIKRVL